MNNQYSITKTASTFVVFNHPSLEGQGGGFYV